MRLLPDPAIQITILDDTHKDECEARCGIDWSLPESLSLVRRQGKERFGDKLVFEYRDLSKAADDSGALSWKKEIRDKNLLLPLLILNGQIRISGLFDFRQIFDAVEVELELEKIN
jgi:hypothetical protein